MIFPGRMTPGLEAAKLAEVNRRASIRFTPLLVASLALAGCASPPEEMGSVVECPPQIPQQDPRLPLAEKEITDLKAQVSRLKKEALAQTKQSQELQLQLAERHSRILQLQLALDQAVQEVVRAKARLRSRNSKAETVANLAELKLELKNAEEKARNSRQQALVHRAGQYLHMSEAALEENNYEGSSYLMTQARHTLARVESPKSDKLNPESAFPVPVTMKTRKLCNVREAPNLKSKVLLQLSPGTEVSAIDREGLWVKVKTSEGKTGWAHFSLLKVSY